MPPNPLAPTSAAEEAGLAATAAASRHADKKPRLSRTDDGVFSCTEGAVTAETSVVEFGKSHHATGICFLDHMVDQLTSHGQLGVTVKVSTANDRDGSVRFHEPRVDYAGGSLSEDDRLHDRDIFTACGASLGAALRDLAERSSAKRGRSESVFLCPLDEALAEVKLVLSNERNDDDDDCDAPTCDLAPYGNMPPKVGRRWIGCYRCELTPVFFERLSAALGCETLTLTKMRGHNAHHVVESTFKAFARVFRACLDEIHLGGKHGCVKVGEDRLDARRKEAQRRQQQQQTTTTTKQRTGSRSRTTKETTIEVNVDLDRFAPDGADGADGAPSSIYTGVELTDEILAEIRTCAGFHFDVRCDGDIYIDDHHTSEDVAITLGQCLNQALGDKAGLARMGCALAEHGNATIRCTMDLSNRPYFEWNLPLDEEYVGGDDEAFAAMRRGAEARNRKIGGSATMLCGSALTCEMLQHVFESLTIETRATVHLELVESDEAKAREPCHPGHTKDLALASARAFGTALAECVRVDPRRAGKVASSKGTLSV